MAFSKSRLSINHQPVTDDEALALLKNSALDGAQIECMSSLKLLLKITFKNGLKAVFRGSRGCLDVFEFVHSPLHFVAAYAVGRCFFRDHNIFPPAVIYRMPKEVLNQTVRDQNNKLYQKLIHFPAYKAPDSYYDGSLSLWIEDSMIADNHPFWKKESAEKLEYPNNLNYEHLENPCDLHWPKEFIREMIYFSAQMQLVRCGDFHAANWVITNDENLPFQIDVQTILSFYDTQKERAAKGECGETNLKWGDADHPRISVFPESLLTKLINVLEKDRESIVRELTHLDGSALGFNRKDIHCLFDQWEKMSAKLRKFRENRINFDTYFNLLKQRQIAFWYHDDKTTPLYFIEE